MAVNFISRCFQPWLGRQFKINEETNIRLFYIYKVIHVKIFMIIPIMKIQIIKLFVGVFLKFDLL